ncbi:hypothetical protein BLNAU_22110 [Blattamonas nauphoetae]|uniref:Uncharacterized protein n=1 Tax=Blattamonas nauphoetae TaxID=2049346 RepID=A0ABQ9WTW7_9EUKA|nr:hypothetical protein BLNAU_22110 [Blattamonas nauphoetae]
MGSAIPPVSDRQYFSVKTDRSVPDSHAYGSADGFVRTSNGAKKVKLTNVIVSKNDPTFFYTQKTPAEREADRQSASTDRHADTHPVGLQVKYPFPTMARPNARMSGNHLTFDVVRVTMVSPVEAQRLGRRLLTDSHSLPRVTSSALRSAHNHGQKEEEKKCVFEISSDDESFSGLDEHHAELEPEEPSSVLIDSDKFLGQMMLPFEQVGEL